MTYWINTPAGHQDTIKSKKPLHIDKGATINWLISYREGTVLFFNEEVEIETRCNIEIWIIPSKDRKEGTGR